MDFPDFIGRVGLIELPPRSGPIEAYDGELTGVIPSDDPEAPLTLGLKDWLEVEAQPITYDASGSFEIDGVIPGRYRLRYALVTSEPRWVEESAFGDRESMSSKLKHLVECTAPNLQDSIIQDRAVLFEGVVVLRTSLVWRGKMNGYVDREIVVPEDVEGGILDLGRIELKMSRSLDIGAMAPSLSSDDSMSEDQFDLNTLRGDRVLLGFSDGGPLSSSAMMRLGDVLREESIAGEKIRLVAVLLAGPLQSRPTRWNVPGRFYDAWRKVYVEDWRSSLVAQEYGFFDVPAFFLIGPDGRVEGADLNLREAYMRVAQLTNE